MPVCFNGRAAKLTLLLATAFLAQGNANAASRPAADRIFIGSSILTMDDSRQDVEAVAVREGRITAVGSRREVMRLRGRDTRVTRLGHHALIPGFFQAHAHFAFIARKTAFVSLDPPPVGDTASIAAIQAALRAALPAKLAADKAILVGSGYDDTLLAEKRHPNREDLDAVSRDIPIILIHISGHMAVANSKALELARIDAATPDPKGGHIERRPGSGEPTGLLQESAMGAALAMIPEPTPVENMAAFEKTADALAARGITTAVDHASSPADVAGMQAFADSGKLKIDLVAFPVLKITPKLNYSPEYRNGFRVGGAKITLDGSIQGYTGFLSEAYHHQASGRAADYRGFPSSAAASIDEDIARLYRESIPFAVHTNGDAAIDLMLDAVAKARALYPRPDLRPVIVHAQTMREDQLDRAKELLLMPSFFEDHVYYWGDRHRDIFLGPVRAERISPVASALKRGMHFTLHDDAPVVPADPLRSVWVAVNRLTANGAVLGADQRIGVMEALKAVTLEPAYQHHEEKEKGSISVGKRADILILDVDPRSVQPGAIRDIRILETIKDGKTIYLRP